MSQSPKNTDQTESVFLDANILLEVILGRPQEAAARRCLAKYAGNLNISALTGHLVAHFGTERVDSDVLQEFLEDYTILPLDEYDFDWAFLNRQNYDFEDALQLAVAVHNGCSDFITLDKTLYKDYKALAEINVQLA